MGKRKNYIRNVKLLQGLQKLHKHYPRHLREQGIHCPITELKYLQHNIEETLH